ncbi:MAG: right-handed parallel beta-helix repeat-containing protein [Promethearchaeota archaeon]
MKQNNVFKFIIVFIGFLFVFGVIFNNVSYKNEIYNTTNINESKKDKISNSGYWILGPITINDNWSNTASTYPWCSGSGSWNDPYIIENVTINAGGIKSGIFIIGSNDFFIINNCTLINSYSSSNQGGIKLLNVQNGRLENNTCINNLGSGIYLEGSDNNTIIGNEVSNNGKDGILLWNCDNNTIIRNEANKNGDIGIEISTGYYNNVSLNKANENDEEGIFLDSCNLTQVSGNTANYNNIDGISLAFSDLNNVTDNNCSYNQRYGIKLGTSNFNRILRNILAYNEKECIYEYNCFGNIIKYNECVEPVSGDDDDDSSDETNVASGFLFLTVDLIFLLMLGSAFDAALITLLLITRVKKSVLDKKVK